jgi:hypothetical protein
VWVAQAAREPYQVKMLTYKEAAPFAEDGCGMLGATYGVVPARQKGQTTDASVVGADDGRGTATKRVGERPARFDPTIS